MGRPKSTPSTKNIMLTLLLLDHASLGRYTLSTYLGISKAKTRSILEYLIELNLATASRGRGGTSLTSKGIETVNELKEYIHLDWKTNILALEDGFVPTDEYAIVLMWVEDISTSGLYERDMAVREGADGAITLIKQDDRWIFPDNPETPATQISIQNPNVADKYNMLSISFAKTRGAAYAGAASIVMYHLGEKISSILAME